MVASLGLNYVGLGFARLDCRVFDTFWVIFPVKTIFRVVVGTAPQQVGIDRNKLPQDATPRGWTAILSNRIPSLAVASITITLMTNLFFANG